MERWKRAGREAMALKTLAVERAVLGVHRDVADVGSLISLMRYAGFDLGKLSMLFLECRQRDGKENSPKSGLRTSLLLGGVKSLGGDDSGMFAAGPLAELILSNCVTNWTSQAVIQALDTTLSSWGLGTGRLATYETSVASGRCLVAIHVVPEEVPHALALMRSSSAESVMLVGRDSSDSDPNHLP